MKFNIYGFRTTDVAKHLTNYTSDQLCRLLKRLSVHGMIRKIGKSYKHYLSKLTDLGMILKFHFSNPAVEPGCFKTHSMDENFRNAYTFDAVLR